MVRLCWVNFQFQGILLIWIIVGQGPTALAEGGGRTFKTLPLQKVWMRLFVNFSLIYLISLLSPSLWETASYRLKYCLKGLLNSKHPSIGCVLKSSAAIECHISLLVL